MFQDFCFKFVNKKVAEKHLIDCGFEVFEEEGQEPSLFHEKAVVDYIGTIFEDTGEVDIEEFPIYEKVEGYHVNVRAWCPELSQKLGSDAFRIVPKSPIRVWA